MYILIIPGRHTTPSLCFYIYSVYLTSRELPEREENKDLRDHTDFRYLVPELL